MPCLQPECVEKNPQATLDNNSEEYCTICYVAGLGEAPSVQLECKHIFHIDCILNKIKKRWPGPRIVFNFLDCPSCKRRIKADHCPRIKNELKEAEKIEDAVVKKAIERAKFENLHTNSRLKDKNDRFYNDLKGFALYKLSYYQCFKCKQAYFGGMKDCE